MHTCALPAYPPIPAHIRSYPCTTMHTRPELEPELEPEFEPELEPELELKPELVPELELKPHAHTSMPVDACAPPNGKWLFAFHYLYS